MLGKLCILVYGSESAISSMKLPYQLNARIVCCKINALWVDCFTDLACHFQCLFSESPKGQIEKLFSGCIELDICLELGRF